MVSEVQCPDCGTPLHAEDDPTRPVQCEWECFCPECWDESTPVGRGACEEAAVADFLSQVEET